MLSLRRMPFCLAFVLLTLVPNALFAQKKGVGETLSPDACPPSVELPMSRVGVTSLARLEPKERLLYSLAGMAGGTLEVRYRVNGQPFVTEVLELAKVELPEHYRSAPDAMPQREDGVQMQRAEPRPTSAQKREGVAAEEVVELLSMQPDTTRELHRLANENVPIMIDVLYNGQPRQTLDFFDLTLRSMELRDKALVPVAAPSTVSGPGLVSGTRRLRVATNTYLENCWECTTSDPCDTECGWDPGKGAPETCGEYGGPCEPYCSPSFTSGEWWTSWTVYSTGYGFGHCFEVYAGQYRWHNQIVTTYRRERIRRTTTCPNSPSCNGCYDSESVIQVQYSSTSCWEETGSSCSGGDKACCWECSVYGWWTCGGVSCY